MDNVKREFLLTDFQKFVLSQIVQSIETNEEFHLYDLIKEAISHKDISSFPDNLIKETHDAITRYLTLHDIIFERMEKRLYGLTPKGQRIMGLEPQRQLKDLMSLNSNI